MNRIQAINIANSGVGSYSFDLPTNYTHLSNLSRINLFVGPNNSGKSRLIRNIADIPALDYLPKCADSETEDFLSGLPKKVFDIQKKHPRSEQHDHLLKQDDIPQNLFVTEGRVRYLTFFDFVNKLERGEVVNNNNRFNNDASIAKELFTLFSPHFETFKSIKENITTNLKFQKIYIPSLRGLRTFGDGEDHYRAITKLHYFKGSEHIDIYTGLSLYEDFKKLLLGTLDDRELATDFQIFLSENFFNGQDVTLIPKHDDNLIHVKIGSEDEYPIQNLGDGIQAIICIIFPLFQARDKEALVFIEEPENCLHPGMQRILLNTLMNSSTFPHHQYFIATHSNHFLDLTLDTGNVSVFACEKTISDNPGNSAQSKFQITNLSTGDDSLLQLLGARASSVFLSNCTIWVEGITDRRYLSHYLNLYQDHLAANAKAERKIPPKIYNEDLHFSFVEYSGSNITHWSVLDSDEDAIDVERLCSKLFLVADSDGAKEGQKAERHALLESYLKDRFHLLECREIENLLSPSILKLVISKFEKSPPEFPSFSYEDYKGEPLGTYIEHTLLRDNRTRSGRYAEDSGTITSKTKFCSRAIEHTLNFEELSSEAQALTVKIYEFIEERNP